MNTNYGIICKILEDNLRVSEEIIKNIQYDEDLRDYGLSSITAIEMIVNIENEFSISIGDEDLIVDNVNTINKIIKLIAKYSDKE